MEVGEQLSQVKAYSDEKGRHEWDAGYIWQLIICPACSNVSLRKGWYHEYTDEIPKFETIYPIRKDNVDGLPDNIQKAFDAALKVKNIEANAYAVLLRRLLELICIDKKADGNNLHQQLEFLAKKNVIPKQLSDMAIQLKNLGNIGAHAGTGDLTEEEIPVLDSLCKAILEYVYTGPLLIQNVASKIERIKRKP